MRQSTELLTVYVHRELVEELHPLMKEALERRPEVINAKTLTDQLTLKYVYSLGFDFSLYGQTPREDIIRPLMTTDFLRNYIYTGCNHFKRFNLP